jgi:hypothetical protein
MMGTSSNGRRVAVALALATLLTVVLMAPVAADNDHRDGFDHHDVNDRRDGFDHRNTDNQRDMVDRCLQSAFLVASDADVSSGSIVGGPYNGWPVVVVSAAGQGLPIGMDVAVPPDAVPFSPSADGGLGLGQVLPSIPAMARFQVVQRTLAGGTFDADRQSLVLLTQPGIIAADSCP